MNDTDGVGSPGGCRIRRVGFRDGSDAELTALHAVEAPVAAERGSNRMPHLIEPYIAFARSLPSQFDDHAWLAEDPAGEPIAAGFCWSNSAGDPRIMECDVLVRRDRRREGIGTGLLAAICETAVADQRSLLVWSTFAAVPAGAAFSRRLGARVGRVSRTSELDLGDVDWRLVETWCAAERARGLGYRLELVEGVFPPELRDDAATFHRIMQTAPKENLDIGEMTVDPDFVAQLDRAFVESGRSRWTLLVRDAAGVCVGGTEVTFEPPGSTSGPVVAHQQNTGIDPAHRRLGLARWAKAAMLLRIRDAKPEIDCVRTDNATSNGAMLAINNALGFRVVQTRTEWQATPDGVLRALGSRARSGRDRGGSGLA